MESDRLYSTNSDDTERRNAAGNSSFSDLCAKNPFAEACQFFKDILLLEFVTACREVLG